MGCFHLIHSHRFSRQYTMMLYYFTLAPKAKVPPPCPAACPAPKIQFVPPVDWPYQASGGSPYCPMPDTILGADRGPLNPDREAARIEGLRASGNTTGELPMFGAPGVPTSCGQGLCPINPQGDYSRQRYAPQQRGPPHPPPAGGGGQKDDNTIWISDDEGCGDELKLFLVDR
ncbi:unnamed protein product [Cyprideis torosa]|uniref:Uncharacterized protein n=1 Tax=Cyprideis torosa TaxID=163714 RepID=A0A7R8WFZ2_9CRUS|nr:unnamed protein product [Cyprideis torosa]CAG0897563.1 unnamed protein product [Cyprideis torosa]